MKITYLNVNCGCGFRGTKLSQAREHHVTTGHVLQVLGRVGNPVPRMPRKRKEWVFEAREQ